MCGLGDRRPHSESAFYAALWSYAALWTQPLKRQNLLPSLRIRSLFPMPLLRHALDRAAEEVDVALHIE